MAKQRFLNNFTSTFIAAVKDAPSSGTPETELDYGVLRISDGAAGSLINPTDGDYYLLTAFKRSGSVESNIEVMRVTGVSNATPGECRITVQRAQEGTSAKAFVAGDYLSLRITRGTAENFSQPADLATKEPVIAAPVSAPTEKYWRGDKTWRDFFTDVRAATLTGLSTATNAVVAATDTVLTAIGKLQKQVSDNLATLTSHTGNTSNPHGVTKVQVGLGNVDNTSDANKPVSTATQTALDTKAPVSHTHDASAIVSGTIADARLPDRLRAAAASITDWNNAQSTGWYMAANAANAPAPSIWFIGSVENHVATGWCTQLVHAFSSDSEYDTKTYRRERNDGVWGTWQRCRITEAEQAAVTQNWWNSTAVPISKVTGLQGALDGKASLTGGGASGTWGINITGTAATVVNPYASSAVRQTGNLGAAYVNWDTSAAPAVQLDTPDSNAAYMVWRATRWGARHVAAMHVYEGNMTVTMSVGNLNNFTWDGSGNFTATGNVTANSDIRLKTDLTKIEGALEKVCAINGYTYTRKDTGARQTGVVAQEVQKVLPEAVMDNGEHFSVAYGNMVGLLIEAIKELKAEVDQLKGK